MTKKQKRMQEIVTKFKRYVASYGLCLNYLDYSDKEFIDDMLYGIGISIS